ncbi:DUF4286 family protein [Formosa sediminum]|uniref:DUF4286 family protein n=1 Tax=Formosa sediminum TaxID=2594004 RepID=A0A516GP82_9FLAO|nr:DUF4286 family protein [Formosa sediminum]QDO93337.1 DUF4286 family protein [Formosa sediminum]
MYIYNVTSNVSDAVHDTWIAWMKQVHIPQVLSVGMFYEAKLTRVLVDEEMGGKTYSVQYRAKSREDLETYYTQFAESLRQETVQKFGENVLSFRTELEVIDVYSVTKH